MQPGGDGRREGEVGIRVGTGDAVLDADRLPLATDTEAGGAVVPRPGDARGSKRTRLVALVGVDVRRVEVGELAREAELAGHPVTEERGAARGALVVEQAPLAGLVGEARMEVEARAGLLHVVLRHEGDTDTLLMRDLLGAVLVDHVIVRGRDGLAVAEVDLLLPRAPLTLAALDQDAGAQHAVADLAMDELLLAGLEDVVVLRVAADRLESLVALVVRVLVGVAEEHELELGGHEDAIAPGVGALHLPAEDAAGRLLDRPPVLLLEIAENERRLLQPRDAAERRPVADRV